MTGAAMLVCMLFIMALGSSVKGDCTKTAVAQLRESLFCGYDRTVRPTLQNTDTMNVSLLLWLRQINFEEAKNTLYIHTWSVWGWRDEHLKWEPNAHQNVQNIRVESQSIWVPDMTLYTTGEMKGAYHHIPNTICILLYDGYVLCVPQTLYVAQCASDLRRWPFDSQICFMEITSWTHSANEINVTLRSNKVLTNNYLPNREWELLNVKSQVVSTEYMNDTYQFLNFEFHLRRHSGGYAATVVIPAFVLSLVTLMVFFLEPDCGERLSLLCMNIVAHCLYLQYLGYKLPSNGNVTPIIVVFFRDSILLVGLSLVIAVVLRGMTAAQRDPPGWINMIVNSIMQTRPGQLLILGTLDPQDAATTSAEDTAGLVDAGSNSLKKTNGWHLAALLLDRVCFIIFVLTFFILIVVYIP